MTDQDFEKLLTEHMDFNKEDIDNSDAGTRKDTRIKRKENSLRDLTKNNSRRL